MATPKISSVLRAFDILSSLHNSPRPLTTDDISSELDLNYKTVHRFLLTLEQIGAVTRIDRNQFTLGLLLADLGQHVAVHRNLRRAAMPELIYLVQTFGQSAQVAVRSSDEALSVAHVPGTKPRGHGIALGRALPLHCTAVGKVILAGMDDVKLHKLTKVLSFEQKTLKTLVSRRAFLDHIVRVRDQGYAINIQESEIDISAVAVPIHNRPGSVLAALSVSGTPDEMTSATIAGLLPELRGCAERISKAIYEPPRRLAGDRVDKARPPDRQAEVSLVLGDRNLTT